MNFRQQTNKLQQVLISKGIIYKINTYQFFSEEQNRMITGFSVTEKQPYEKKDGTIGMHDVELKRTCSQIELLKWFAEKWRKANERK